VKKSNIDKCYTIRSMFIFNTIIYDKNLTVYMSCIKDQKLKFVFVIWSKNIETQQVICFLSIYLSVHTVCLLIINFIFFLLYSSKVTNRSQLGCLYMQCASSSERSIIYSLLHSQNVLIGKMNMRWMRLCVKFDCIFLY